MSAAIYLRLDKAKAPAARLTVEGSGRVPHVFRGNAATFRVAVFNPDSAVADLADHSSLNLAYMPASRTGDALALATATIAFATFTLEEWQAGTRWHAEFEFSEGDMNPSLDGISENYWLVLYGILSGSGYEVTHGGGSLTIEEDGTENTVSSPEPPAVGVTMPQVEAVVESLVSDAVDDVLEEAIGEAFAGVLKSDGSVDGAAMQTLGGLAYVAPTELTIASGSITATQTLHTVDTQEDASSDDLDTIVAAKGSGDELILAPAHTDRTVVLKHGTGNIITSDGQDLTLDSTAKAVRLLRWGSSWLVWGNVVNASGLGEMMPVLMYAAKTSGTNYEALGVRASTYVNGKIVIIRPEAGVDGGDDADVRLKSGKVSGAFANFSDGVAVVGPTLGIGFNENAFQCAFYAIDQGVLRVTAGDQTNFNRLVFGNWITDAYPSIKRDGAALRTRLADDSADAPHYVSRLIASESLRPTPTTVSALGSASGYGDGTFRSVTDALSPVIGEVVTGGGAVKVTVRSDGTNWRVVTTTSALSGGGIDPEVAYIRTGGSDISGTVGSPGLPYATAQAAWDDGARSFDLGDGAWTIEHESAGGPAAEVEVYVRGKGAAFTSLDLVWTGGESSFGGYTPDTLILRSDGSVSIALELLGGDANPESETSEDGGDVPDHYLYGCEISSYTAVGGSGISGGNSGANAAVAYAEHSAIRTGTLTATTVTKLGVVQGGTYHTS